MGSFIKWYCRQIGKSKLSKANLEGLVYKVVIAFHKNIISLQFQMEKCHLLLTHQIDLVNPEGNRVVPDVSKPLPIGGSKERRNALSISKMKTAYYPDFGLEELQKRQCPSDRRAVRSHIGILSVVSLKTFSRYGYDYLKEIVLRRADYQEYKISEADFKNLHLNDFEDLYLLHLQGKLNHLSGADKVYLFNAVNLLFKYNPGMENRIWSEDDKRRSKEFMEVIERRLKIRRIFRNLESFVLCVGYPSDTYVFTVKMEILEPTSNKLLVGSYKDGDDDIQFQQSQVHNRMLILNRHILNFKKA
ncbi:hypothetical protein Tco_0381751 [Tanacetum coccineum]